MADFFYLKCLIYINIYQYASRTWVKSTNELMLMLDEASVDKGAKKEAAAAPGLGYVDLPNTQIRKVRSVQWDSSNLELFEHTCCLWRTLLLLTVFFFLRSLQTACCNLSRPFLTTI